MVTSFPGAMPLVLLEEGINFDEFDPSSLADVGLEEEVFDRYVICTRGHLDSFGSSDGSIVVFEDRGLDCDLFVIG